MMVVLSLCRLDGFPDWLMEPLLNVQMCRLQVVDLVSIGPIWTKILALKDCCLEKNRWRVAPRLPGGWSNDALNNAPHDQAGLLTATSFDAILEPIRQGWETRGITQQDLEALFEEARNAGSTQQTASEYLGLRTDEPCR